MPLHLGPFQSFGLALVCVLPLFLGYFVFRYQSPRKHAAVAKWWTTYSGWFTSFVGLFVLVCGTAGFIQRDGFKLSEIPLIIYQTVQLFSMNASLGGEAGQETNVWLGIAAFAAPLFAFLLVTGVISKLYDGTFEAMRMRYARDHLVVCGYGRIGREIVLSFVRDTASANVIVIDNSMEIDDFQMLKRQGVMLIQGNAQFQSNLDKAQVYRASEIVVATGRDELNIEIAMRIKEEFAKPRTPSWWAPLREFGSEVVDFLKQLQDGFSLWLAGGSEYVSDEEQRRSARCTDKGEGPTLCHLHILDQDLANTAREQLSPSGDDSLALHVRFKIFNAVERTARRVMQSIVCHPEKLIPQTPEETAHFVIIGFQDFGQAIALQMAELAHFRNCKRLRMTILDKDIKPIAEHFLAKHPGFASPVERPDPWLFSPQEDEWAFKGWRWLPRRTPRKRNRDPGIDFCCNVGFDEYTDVADDALVRKMHFAFQENVKPIVFVCMEDDKLNYSTASRLKARMRANQIECPVYVWLSQRAELTRMASKKSRQPKRSQGGASATQGLAMSSVDVDGPVNTSLPIPFGLCTQAVSYGEVTDPWFEWLGQWLNYAYHCKYKLPEEAAKENEGGEAARNGRPKLSPGAAWKGLEEHFERFRTEHYPDLGAAKESFDQVCDDMLPVWDSLSEDHRLSSHCAAIHSVVKLATIGLQIDSHNKEPRNPRLHPDAINVLDEFEDPNHELWRALCKMEHNRWVSDRLLRGWRYAKENSDESKTRKSLVPWELLPPGEQQKDYVALQMLFRLCRFGALSVSPLKLAQATEIRTAETEGVATPG